MDWLKCNICFNIYNDLNLRPRVLNCGHSFCEKCLYNTIQNEKLTCPQCRKKCHINSVADLPINFVLEGLLKSLNLCSQGAITKPIEEQYGHGDKSEDNGTLKTILEQDKENACQKDTLKESAGLCIEHPNTELIFRCSSHKCWVCEKCIEMQGDHHKDYCTIISFKEEIEDRRKEHEHIIENKERLCNKNFLLIEKHITDLSDKITLHISLVDNLQDLMTMHKNEEKSLQNERMFFEKIIESGNNVKQRLLDVKGTVQNAATLDESNTARDLLDNRIKETSKWIKTSEKEVEERNAKLKRSAQCAMSTKKILDSKDNNRALLQDLELDSCSQQNQQLEAEINKNNNCLMKNNKSKVPRSSTDDVCDIHREKVVYWCFECQIWICKECLESHSSLIGCSVIPSAEAMENMKEKQSRNADIVITLFDKKVKYMTFIIQEHNDKKEELFERFDEQRKELLEKTDEQDKEVKRLSTLLKLGKLHKKKLVECKENLNLEKTPYAVCNQIKVLSHMKQLLRTWNLKSREADALIELLIALKRHKLVSVVIINQNLKRYAKVSKDQEDIFIHTFQTRELVEEEADEEKKDEDTEEEDVEVLVDENNDEVGGDDDDDEEVAEESKDGEMNDEDHVVIEFDCQEKLIPKEVSLVFLLFTLPGLPNVLMKSVQIRLTTNMLHVRENILQIFSGQNSQSLRNIQFYWNRYNIKSGTIENFKESKIAPTFSDTNEAKSGDVIANYENGYLSQLFLVVNPYNYTCKSLVVGKIEKGFETIKSLHRHEASNMKIYDCGLVIEEKFIKL